MIQEEDPRLDEEVPLTGDLAEFRIALREEIEAAKRTESSAAVPLTNGRRIGQIGGSYQYLFGIESPLNVPGDAPGNLHVPGRVPLDVTIVSTDGLAITLSVPEDLGAFVPSARLQSNLAQLMRKLIERIEIRATVPNPVGDRVRGLGAVTGEPVAIDERRLDLDDEQSSALASSLGRNATFIWGPPGTGKTRTIGAIGVALHGRHRSALVVSHTNMAVDQALMRIGEAVDESVRAAGKILRVGDPKDSRLQGFPDLLLKTHVDRRFQTLSEKRDALMAERERHVERVLTLSRTLDICEWTHVARQDLSEMERALRELQALDRKLADLRAEQRDLSSAQAYWNEARAAAQRAAREAENDRRLPESNG